jgi:hypothetical protein
MNFLKTKVGTYHHALLKRASGRLVRNSKKRWSLGVQAHRQYGRRNMHRGNALGFFSVLPLPFE